MLATTIGMHYHLLAATERLVMQLTGTAYLLVPLTCWYRLLPAITCLLLLLACWYLMWMHPLFCKVQLIICYLMAAATASLLHPLTYCTSCLPLLHTWYSLLLVIPLDCSYHLLAANICLLLPLDSCCLLLAASYFECNPLLARYNLLVAIKYLLLQLAATFLLATITCLLLFNECATSWLLLPLAYS